MKNHTAIDRRQLIQGAMLLAGLAIFPTSRCLSADDASRIVSIDPSIRKLVVALSDAIIPRTDTPGAVDAKVPALFEEMLDKWASTESRNRLLDGLGEIDKTARSKTSRSFIDLNEAQRHEILTALDEDGEKQNLVFGTIKMLIVSLYYMSEPGSTVELRYDHVPGRWDPSLPVTAETRTQGGA